MNTDPPESKTDKKRNLPRISRIAFYSIALLFIFALLGMLVPANTHGKHPPSIRALTEMRNLQTAIGQYIATYGGFPISTNISGGTAADFTFGTFNTSAAKFGITNDSGYQANNSEVMAILMDYDQPNLPNGGPNVFNLNHAKNPQHLSFFTGKQVDDTSSPGIGTDGVYRDPWGNPYIITIDLNGDGKCRDVFYRLASVSETNSSDQRGLFGLERPKPGSYTTPAARDSFELHNTVMIWSLGPDGKADRTKKANQDVNKDNVASWR